MQYVHVCFRKSLPKSTIVTSYSFSKFAIFFPSFCWEAIWYSFVLKEKLHIFVFAIWNAGNKNKWHIYFMRFSFVLPLKHDEKNKILKRHIQLFWNVIQIDVATERIVCMYSRKENVVFICYNTNETKRAFQEQIN